ncbi:unnamed protein product [Camellia sinensis]
MKGKWSRRAAPGQPTRHLAGHSIPSTNSPSSSCQEQNEPDLNVVNPQTLYNVNHSNNVMTIQLMIFSHIIMNKPIHISLIDQLLWGESSHDVNLEGEVDVRITSPISECTLTRVGGADTLMGSINFENKPIPDEEEPNDNAMPPNEQPHYWTDYLALEQEWYNQRLQLEQQMANQLNTLGTRFDEFVAAQNSLIQQFGEFHVDSGRRDEVTRNRID